MENCSPDLRQQAFVKETPCILATVKERGSSRAPVIIGACDQRMLVNKSEGRERLQEGIVLGSCLIHDVRVYSLKMKLLDQKICLFFFAQKEVVHQGVKEYVSKVQNLS